MATAVADVAAIRKTEAIQLRIAGHTQAAVAERLGVSQQQVSLYELDWLASRKPSAEVTEERRQQQLAGIDATRARLSDLLADDDLELAARLAVVDRIAKLWEREAKLVGLDLERGVSVTLVTREALASALWDVEADAVELPSGDVEAVEITDGEGEADA
jgi:predicted transcriptional regulator